MRIFILQQAISFMPAFLVAGSLFLHFVSFAG